ncbi:MAG: hypothetical protein KJ057_14290 [Phycisphaerae bacterium]|nr:MAG: hypothetical protein F9K17_07685 [Phycisphaerae bacterium]MBE7458831.1 hypothetical protein [Planctomycetia bacterium]MCK6465845.1 hypothetical protein [Phycisphaerae bacterium]MCL4719635.1 hypothetical protein [Phycisphaerae bacterium]NUQ10305.1 hypothetical protein [Phycisphaerae bacterium]
MRENRAKGFFVAFDFSTDAPRKIDAFFRRSGKVIVPLSVREILHEEIARKPVRVLWIRGWRTRASLSRSFLCALCVLCGSIPFPLRA